MRVPHLVCFSTLLTAALLAASTSHAAIINWGGSSGGDYFTDANWVGGARPQTWVNGGDSAVISSGSAIANSQLDLAYGNSLTINGGALSTTGTLNLNFGSGGGIFVLSAGSFSGVGVNANSASAFTISGGSANFSTTNLLFGGVYTQSGGTLTGGGDVYLSSSAGGISGGTLNAGFLGILGSGTVVNFSAGTINAPRFDIQNAGNYLNFTTGSTGTFYITNQFYNAGQVQNLFTDGKIRYNGLTGASNFNVLDSGSGFYITAVAAVPEPSTAAFLGLTAVGAFIGVKSRQKRAICSA